ncbi:MAG: T9SS type A sorting domain-containing protein [Bacteroidota bacterium]
MSISMTEKNITCPGYNNGVANVSVLGGTIPYSYHWSPIIGGSLSIWNLEAGFYRVQVIDALGCSNIDSIIVNNPDTISLTINATPSDCHMHSGTAKVLASGGSSPLTYFWPLFGLSNDSVGELAADLYQVIISDAKGCILDTSVVISDIDGPSVAVDSIVNVKCKGYDNGLLSIINNEEGPISLSFLCTVPGSQNLEAGVYPVLATDSNGCKTGLEITITEPDLLDLSVSTLPSNCGISIGKASVVVNGGTAPYTYQWSSGGTDSIENNLPSGFDTLFVTDFNGCESWKVILVIDSDGPILTTNSVNLTCFDSTYGQVFVTASAGAVPFQYLWYEIGQTDSSVDSLSAGNYRVLVIDSNGCKQSSVATIISPPSLQLDVDINYPATDSTMDGSAAAYVQGGIPPYEYFWFPDSQLTRNISRLGNNDLAVTVTDSNGCSTHKDIHSHTPPFLPCLNANYCNAEDEMPGCDFTTLPYAYGTTTLNIQDFGAVGDGVTNDECAFEFANYYINQLYNLHSNTLSPNAIVSLQFPPGTYIVGRQTFWGEVRFIPSWGQNLPQECWYAKGHNIFALKYINGPNAVQINPLIIEGLPDMDGKYPTIKYADCLYYGAFKPDPPHEGERLLLNTTRDPFNCEIAFPGDLFRIGNSKYITIKNIELNGNFNNFTIGGGTIHSDNGMSAATAHSCIGLFGDDVSNGSSDILIKNVNVHHFGYSGLQVGHSNRAANINLTLIDSKFNSNGCCGFAWEAGAIVRASNCQFNKNALEILQTKEASGIDIETQGGPLPAHGLFNNCEFKYNRRNGVQSQDHGGEEHFTFYKCTFVSSEYHPWTGALKDGSCIYMESAKVSFTCCSFYGFIDRARDEYLSSVNRTVFSNCNFNEEYYDPDENKTFSFNTVCGINDCTDPNLSGSAEGYMIQLSAIPFRRVTFKKCNFTTNFSSSICTMLGGTSQVSFQNAIIIQNCRFVNHGLNEYSTVFNCGFFQPGINRSNRFLMYLWGINFIGNNTLDYARDQGCQFANGLGYRRNALSIINSDYKWGIESSWKNWIPGYKISQSFNDIHDYYWKSDCSAPVVVPPAPGIPPFDLVNLGIHDDTYYWPCQERFENPTTLQIWSSSANIEYEYPPLCIVPPPPPNEPERLVNQEIDNIENDLEVSPVPAKDFITIYNLSKGDNVYFYDIYGKEIFRIAGTLKEMNVDIHSLSNGIYFIKSSSSKTKKIIKIE